jgi:hypothetical protein
LDVVIKITIMPIKSIIMKVNYYYYNAKGVKKKIWSRHVITHFIVNYSISKSITAFLLFIQ